MQESTFTPHPLGDKQWKELQGLKPEDVARRASVRFDEKGFYVVPFMNKEYHIYPEEERIEGPAGDVLASDEEFILLLLTYLISAKDVMFMGKWVSEHDLPGGDLFFKGPHVLPTDDLIARYGKNSEKFLEVGRALGGKRMPEYGDVGLEFQALPRVPVACVLWVEDEEFPARVSFLFDPSIESHLQLDVVLGLVRCVAKNLLESREANKE
jgi:hypothetical protein